MLFSITQEHTPESCRKDTGGSKALHDPKAEGVSLKAMYFTPFREEPTVR